MASQRKNDTYRQDEPPGPMSGPTPKGRAPASEAPRSGASDLLGSYSTLDVSRDEVDRLVDDMMREEDATERSLRAPSAKLADTMRDEAETAKAVEQLLKEPEDSWSASDRTVRTLRAPPVEVFTVGSKAAKNAIPRPEPPSGARGIVPAMPPPAPTLRRNTPAPLPPELTRRVAIDPDLLAESIPREEEVTKKSIPLPELLERSTHRDDEDPLARFRAPVPASYGQGLEYASMEELEHLSLPEDAGQFVKDVSKTPSQTPLPPPPQRPPPPPIEVPDVPPTSGIAEIVQDEPPGGRVSTSSGFPAFAANTPSYEGRDSALSAPPATRAAGFRVGLLGLALFTTTALILGVVIGGILVAALYLGSGDRAFTDEHAGGERGESSPVPVASAEPALPSVEVVSPVPAAVVAPAAPPAPEPIPNPTPEQHPAASPSDPPEEPAVEVAVEAATPASEQPASPPQSAGGLSPDAADLPDEVLLPIDFRTGSPRPERMDDAVLAQIAGIMTENRRMRLEVVGFVGPGEGVDAERVEHLALMRAESAVESIRAHGPSRRRFSARAAGTDEEVVATPTAEGFQRAAIIRVTQR